MVKSSEDESMRPNTGALAKAVLTMGAGEVAPFEYVFENISKKFF